LFKIALKREVIHNSTIKCSKKWIRTRFVAYLLENLCGENARHEDNFFVFLMIYAEKNIILEEIFNKE